MSYRVKRTDGEVDEVLNKAAEQEDKGGSQWPGMTYEQGVQAGIQWLIGNWDHNPMEDD